MKKIRSILKRLKNCWRLLTCGGYFLATVDDFNVDYKKRGRSMILYRTDLALTDMVSLSENIVSMLDNDVSDYEKGVVKEKQDAAVDIVNDILNGNM